MKKINVVLLTDCLGDITGGAEKQIFEVAKRLPKDRYHVTIASMEAQGVTSQPLIESIGCQLKTFRVVRIYGLSGFIQGLRFFSFLRNHRVGALMTYHFGSDIWGTFWAHLAGVPLIISNRRDMGFWRNESHVMAYRLINGWVNTIVAVTSSVKQMVLNTERIREDKVKVITNGVDWAPRSSDGQKKKAELGLKPQDIVIMHVANLRPVKGHKFLIEAFSKAAGRFAGIKLVLIGKDELNGQLQNLAETLKVKDQVLFLGQRTDVQELLAASDICVLPSLSEGMSNAILEYMASSKPVIATNVGGNPELVRNGYNGLLVDSENTAQLAEALLDLIGSKEKRQTMGQNGLLRVKGEFSMEAMMARYDKLFGRTKVLHLVSSTGLFGAERVILNLAVKNHEVDSCVGALYNLHNPHLEMIEEAGRLGLKNTVFESKGRFDLRTIVEVKKFLLENDIDILHTHNYKSDIIGFWASRWAKKKWVATNHVWHSTDKKLRFYEKIDAFVLKSAQKVVCVSDEIKDDLLKKGFKEDRLRVIDNGIPIADFNREFPVQQTRLGLGVKDFECAVVIVGRLAVEKGHGILLQAASKIVEKTKKVKFIIVGDGPLSESLRQKTKELDLSDYVIFTGIRDDMPMVYASCDIMVNASYIEGLPMTILEAMASRLPVIATRTGAVGQVIKNKENGILLEPGDPESLAGAIMELAGDERERRRLAEKAFQDVNERFSDTRMADQYNQIYSSMA